MSLVTLASQSLSNTTLYQQEPDYGFNASIMVQAKLKGIDDSSDPNRTFENYTMLQLDCVPSYAIIAPSTPTAR